MDVVDLTCEQTEADSTDVVLLDMIDVCCEVDVGDLMTTSSPEVKADICSSGVRSAKSDMAHKRQPARCVKFIANDMDSFDDVWEDSLIDTCDEYQDSDTESQNDCLSCMMRAKTITKESSTQTDNPRKPCMTVVDFMNKPDVIAFYTGLKSYDSFMHMFNSLVPECHQLEYGNDAIEVLPILDQLFLTLMKLRTNKDDFDLSVLFDISLKSVRNIFETWVIFMHKRWTQLDLWLPKALFNSSMPLEIKSLFPQARVIVDCLEFPISMPNDDVSQLATLRSNPFDHTLKVLVGITPNGLVSFCSETFGGDTKESEIFELSGILSKLEPNDAVLVDERFDVKKICSSKEVTVYSVDLKKVLGHGFSLPSVNSNNQCYPLKSLDYLLKGNQILSQRLSSDLLPLANQICFVCIMMNNFLMLEC